jgi:hypothetical protein
MAAGADGLGVCDGSALGLVAAASPDVVSRTAGGAGASDGAGKIAGGVGSTAAVGVSGQIDGAGSGSVAVGSIASAGASVVAGSAEAKLA